jgi:pimeloyl-ACP methyl ester carboxylesterase
MALLFVKQPVAPALFMKIIAEDWIAHTAFNKKIWDDTEPVHYSLKPLLHLIQAPVLIIWGDQDKLTDVGGVEFLEKNLRYSRTVVMKDTGHVPMIERPGETANVYLDFLKAKK